MNKNGGLGNTIRICSLGFFVTASILFFSAGDYHDTYFINLCIIAASIFVVFQGMRNYLVAYGKNWFQIDLMFLVMFFFVHFWYWIASEAGLEDNIWVIWRHEERADYSVALALLGMASFILGFNLRNHRKTIRPLTERYESSWKLSGYLIFYVGVILNLFYATIIGVEAFQGRYAGSEIGGLSARSIYLTQGILIKLGFLIILVSYRNKNHRLPRIKIPLVIVSLVLLMYLVLGDRSEFFLTMAMIVIAYGHCYKRVSLKYAVIGILSAAILMHVVQEARNSANRSATMIMDTMLSEQRESSVISGLNNVGSSTQVLQAAVSVVPKQFPYFMGTLKIIEIQGVIPFGRKLFIGDKSYPSYETSSQFLTWIVFGNYSRSGVGTTLIADLYVDFGPLGVIAGLFFLGFISRLLKEKIDSVPTTISLVTFLYFAGVMTIISRYSFLMILRGLIWPLIFLWLIEKIIIMYNSKTHKGKLLIGNI